MSGNKTIEVGGTEVTVSSTKDGFEVTPAEENEDDEPSIREAVEKYAERHPLIEKVSRLGRIDGIGDTGYFYLSLKGKAPGNSAIGNSRVDATEELDKAGISIRPECFEESSGKIEGDILLGFRIVEPEEAW